MLPNLKPLYDVVDVIAFDSLIDSRRHLRIVPDVFIFFADFDVLNVLEICRRIAVEFAGTKVLVIFDTYHATKYHNQLRRAGVHGFSLRSAGVYDLVNAVETLLRGEEYFNPLTRSLEKTSPKASLLNMQLTDREVEVLKLIKSENHVISKILEMKPRSVEKHLECIFAKLGVRTRAEAIAKAEELGYTLVPPFDDEHGLS